MQDYETLVEALNGLNQRGYKHDFNITSACLFCKEVNQSFPIDEFKVVEHHRFEGASDPGDLSEVYAIETNTGLKGILIDGYGISSALPLPIVKQLSAKLTARKKT